MQFCMLFFFDKNDEVTIGTATFSGIASSPNTQLHSFLYAGRYIDAHGLFAVHSSFAFTVSAFVRYRGSFTVTGWASCYRLHLAQKCVAHFSYLAASAA